MASITLKINIPDSFNTDAEYINNIGLNKERNIFKSLEKYYAQVEDYDKAIAYRDIISR